MFGMKVGLRGLFYPVILDRDMITGESFRNWTPSFLCPFLKIFERRHQKGGTLEVLGDETLESLFSPVRLHEVWTAIKSFKKLPPPPPPYFCVHLSKF
jgi:hypothetical protein